MIFKTKLANFALFTALLFIPACKDGTADVESEAPLSPSQPTIYSDVEELPGLVSPLTNIEKYKALNIHPVVNCSDDICDIRMSVEINDKAALSQTLKFKAPSDTVSNIDLYDENIGAFGLGPTQGRNISAWQVGDFESGVGIAVEAIDINGGTGFIVHQSAGFEHVKRSHAIMEIVGNELQTREVINEGAGPHIISVYPANNGITIRRRLSSGADVGDLENYSWDKGEGQSILKRVD